MNTVRMKPATTSFYIGIHHHTHGEDVYLFEGNRSPDDAELEAVIPDKEEWTEVHGPMKVHHV